MAPQTSVVWKFFIKNGDGSAICKACEKTYQTSGNTSNLMGHLRKMHSTMLEDKKTQENQNSKAESPPPKRLKPMEPETNISNPSSAQSSKQSSQLGIKGCFGNISAFKENGVKYKKLTEKILFMICKDAESFSMVEREDSKEVIAYVAPQYKIPCRMTFTNLLDSKYKQLSSIYKEMLKEATDFTLTTDLWLDTMQTRSFIGVTVHFRKQDEMQSGILAVEQISVRHTAENLVQVLRNLCENWDIEKEKISAITTDNAANIVKAIDLFLGKKFHLACYPHTLNLVASNSINSKKDLVELIKKVKAIVTWFKRCTPASDELRERTDLRFKEDVETRWNSLLYMLQRFLQLRIFANDIILRHASAPPMLTAREIYILFEIVEILTPLEEATRELCAEKYVSSRKVIPMTHCLEATIVDLTPIYDESKQLKDRILIEISRRFKMIENNHILAISTLLNPRFKKVHFRDPLACSKAISYVKNLIKPSGQEGTNFESVSALSELQEGTDQKKKSVWSKHVEAVQLAIRNRANSDVQETDELTPFLNAPLAKLEDNPLKLWLEMVPVYPNLSKVALKYLSIVASSVHCERLFSKAGITLTEKRNRLKGSRLYKQLFMQSIDKSHW